jgi:hypothetical protein
MYNEFFFFLIINLLKKKNNLRALAIEARFPRSQRVTLPLSYIRFNEN